MINFHLIFSLTSFITDLVLLNCHKKNLHIQDVMLNFAVYSTGPHIKVKVEVGSSILYREVNFYNSTKSLGTIAKISSSSVRTSLFFFKAFSAFT